MRDHLRRHLAVAAALGLARCRIEHRGTPHPRLVGERADGRTFSFVVGGTVHTHGRALANSLARLKRRLRTPVAIDQPPRKKETDHVR